MAGRSRRRERHSLLQQDIAHDDIEIPSARRFDRLIFLSDGVFAIAMTLLVVELTVPVVSPSDPSALANALLALRPKFVSFGISFVVIASSDKPVERIGPPIPLELLAFGLQATLRALGNGTLRDVPRSPDGGVIADYNGRVDDPQALSAYLDSMPGVVDHGLFPPSLVYEILVGRGEKVQRLVPPA